ncbi:hypothetical protein Dacet_2233 [Denitrovibrio acetiphilus DSM 12809]|uniref:Head decoration protein n=1 Tax=Denitrovibrio acetiphilus (strain DSM 12809 / NBRC 114555 / N2460) TaxID=522772 RepID=D4H2X2_DENA2|nr:hypothetical protein [Denitrovibrio acetiphilus]ADD68995.1 hypothetical protein Dacet_2233 [Denitrovibrio acetiphilus DSM 12809]
MATVNGIIGHQTVTDKSVIDDRHPAVIRFKQFKADNGTIPAGEIVALDANGYVVSYDPASAATEATPVGVCIMDTDTSKDTIGNVVVHGTVIGKNLLTNGTASKPEETAALEANTLIWSF